MAIPNATCTVVIPCYNAEPFLEVAIASVRQQTMREYHIVVVDDASPDNSIQLAQRLAALSSDMTIIALPENRGRCHARNQGARASTGPYVTFLDQDDTYHPDFLAKTIEGLETHRVYDAIKVLPNLSVNIDKVRYEAIANSLATTTIFRRPAFEFIGGWPESEIYRLHPGGCEDIALLETFGMCFNLGVLHAKFYNYTLRPGNALDRFLKRSSVIDGVLHLTGRNEQDVVLDNETLRLKQLARSRMRRTLLNSPVGLVSLEAEVKEPTSPQNQNDPKRDTGVEPV